MTKYSRMLGATLLEVMLVLAVAAMIIVMSVRYYQTATANQQVNSALSIIQGISAAADGLAQATGSYTAGGVDTASIAALMPAGVKDAAGTSMTSPWGGTVTVSAGSATTYTITFSNTPQAVCSLVKSRVVASSKFTSATTCSTGSGNSLAITYNSAS